MSDLRRRATDVHWWSRLVRENWYRDIWLLIITVTSMWAVLTSLSHIRAVEREGAERRDQSCLLFERQDQLAKARLAATYSYLDGLTPAERRENLNRTVLRSLPQTVADARNSAAPAYCDAPGIGLTDPRPKMPQRPKSLPK